jgi:catechol 2,3-dioxygenase-like lactoylglutathione lyase family enzyme
MRPTSFDHVALWVSQRQPIADFLCDHLGMHVIERTESFTLVGADAREGKVTLFDADGPRERGALERIVLRVSDLDAALSRLPDELDVRREEDGVARFEGPEGLGLGLLEGADGLEYDLDHVVLRVRDPEHVRDELVELGFAPANGRLVIADRAVELRPGDPGASERPLLNHLAVLVDSAEEHLDEARRREVEVEDVKDAPNTLAVFVRGPEGIRLEYVEHKPGFSLR